MHKLNWYIFPLILFTLLFWFSIPNGVEDYTFDAQEYKHAAESFASGKCLLERETDYIHYAPLYPVFLSVGVDDLSEYASVLHWICWVMTLVVWLKITKENIDDKLLKGIAAFLICSSVYAFVSTRQLWSESLFLPFLSVFLYSVWSVKGVKSKRELVVCSFIIILFGSLMVLTRFAGMMFVVYALIWLVINFYQDSKQRLVVVPTVLVGVVYYLYRAVYLGKQASGRISDLTLLERLSQLTERVDWYYNQFLDYFLPLIPIGGLVGMLIVIVFWVGGLIVMKNISENKKRLFYFSFFYVHFLLLLIFLKNFGTHEDTYRYMDVVGMVFYVTFISTIEVFFNQVKWHKSIMYVIVFSVVALNFSRTIYNVLRWNNIL